MPAAGLDWMLLRALARGLHLAGSFGVFGTVLLTVLFVPPEAPLLRLALRRLAWGSLGVALTAGLAWFVLQSADMAGTTNLADLWQALPVVAETTRFGNLLIGRAVVLLTAALCFQFAGARSLGAWMGTALAALAVAAEAWLDHGGAMTGTVGSVLLVSDIAHLLSAAAWLGSLPALWLAIDRLPLDLAARIAWRFSPFGVFCVLVLIGSALVQFIVLIGAPAALVSTGYGAVVMVKILLFLLLLGLAAANRYQLAPALFTQPTARTALRRSIGAEIALGMAVLLAAGVLLNLTPPTMAAMLRQENPQ
jgi:putative copper resistance protein D